MPTRATAASASLEKKVRLTPTEREYKNVVSPLGELYTMLSQFIARPEAAKLPAKELASAVRTFGDLLDRKDIKGIVNSWWGLSDELHDNMLEDMRMTRQAAGKALRTSAKVEAKAPASAKAMSGKPVKKTPAKVMKKSTKKAAPKKVKKAAKGKKGKKR